MDKLPFVGVGFAFCLLALAGYVSFDTNEKKETCIIEGMAQHYSASDIQNICKF